MSDNSDTQNQPSERNQTQDHNSSDVFRFIERFVQDFRAVFYKCFRGENYMNIVEADTKVTLRIEKNFCGDFLIKTLRHFGFRGGRNRDLSTRIMDEFCGLCLESSIKERVSIRTAKQDKNIYIDLGNSIGTIVKITPGQGFAVEKNAPVNFFRPPHQRELPVPVFTDKDEFLKVWEKTFRFKNPDGNYLLLAFVLQSLIPQNGSYPILILQGPQASGKTTASKRIKMIIDPSHPLLLGMQRSEDDLYVTASSEYLLAYDNMSHLPNELADVFCRFSTGGGSTKRQLFSNDGLKVFDIQMPILFNGIQELSDRPDFLDRAIVLHLQPLKDSERKIESATEEEFQRIHPKLLGGLYSLLSHILSNLDSITNSGLPRMGDFARVGLAMDKVLNKPEGHFLKIYETHLDSKIQESFENSPFCLAIHSGLRLDGYVEGNITRLYSHFFKSKMKHYGSGFPNGPKGFRGYLERHKHILEANNIEIGSIPRTSSERGLYIKFKDTPFPPITSPDDLLI